MSKEVFNPEGWSPEDLNPSMYFKADKNVITTKNGKVAYWLDASSPWYRVLWYKFKAYFE